MKTTPSPQRHALRAMHGVLQELRCARYGISAPALHRMEAQLRRCAVYTADAAPESAANAGARLTERLRAASGGWTVWPCLYLPAEGGALQREEMLYHELMHLFAGGACTPLRPPELFLYRSGVELYHIHGQSRLVRVNDLGLLNEMLTDCTAAFLYERLTGRAYRGSAPFAQLHMRAFTARRLAARSMRWEQLVGGYLSHDDETLCRIFARPPEADLAPLERLLRRCCAAGRALDAPPADEAAFAWETL